MSDSNLRQLEQEVEAARAKLNSDLSTLRSPRTYSDFTSDLKNDALDVKDALLDQAKSSVHSTMNNFIEDLKAKAAANPAAALAIGAGIAWRLMQRPPIATVLIGAGLYSLFRTTPTQPTSRTTEDYLTLAKDRLGEQASDFAESVKDHAMALGQSAAGKTTELAGSIRDQALAVGEAVSDKAAELTGAATNQAQHWSDEVRQAAAKVADRTSHDAISDEWSRPTHSNGNEEARDKMLLGAAGFAVVAALGVALQRRMSEPADADPRN